MKKLFLFLLLIGVAFPTTDTTHTLKTYSTAIASYPDDSNQGMWFYDSLWTGNYALPNDTTIAGTDTTIILDTVAARTSIIIPTNFQYDWLYIVTEDTGTTYDDTLKIETGVIKYVKGKIASDTTWHGLSFKDSTWTTISTNIPVDDNSVHAYSTFLPLGEMTKITITNVEAVVKRVAYIWGYGKKK